MYSNIPRGSLSVEGIPIVSKEIVSKCNNLENQPCEQCRIIQTDGLLCQNLETQRYFRIGLSDIEYVDIPQQEGKVALSYQIRGKFVSIEDFFEFSYFEIIYDLNILSKDCQHTFQAFAEMNNETKQEYQIDRTELFTGDIRLETDLVI